MTTRVSLPTWLLFVAAGMTVLLLAFVIASPFLQGFIEDSGVNIPTSNVLSDYAGGIVWGCVLMLSIFTWPIRWEHKKLVGMAWLLKCVVALAAMLPYEQRYYNIDCWAYFQRAHGSLVDLLPGFTRGGTEVVVILGALHLKIGPDSYHAMKLSFAMIGLVGIYLFYRAAELLLGKYSPVTFWVLMLYPSVLFWSSILGKDPLILAAIGLHVWGLVNVAVRRKYGYLAAVLMGIAAASAVRIWMGPILIVPCLFVLGMRIKHMGWRIVAIVLVLSALATLGPATAERFSLDQATDLVEATRTMTEGWERANSSLGRDVELRSLWDLIVFTPQGFFIAYFRPLPGDVANIFGWMAGFENLGLLLLSIWALFRVRLAYLRNHLFLWGVVLLATWGLAYSIISYKDLGAAVRYKLQVIPILLCMIGYLIRQPSRQRAANRAMERIDRSRAYERQLRPT